MCGAAKTDAIFPKVSEWVLFLTIAIGPGFPRRESLLRIAQPAGSRDGILTLFQEFVEP